MDIFETKVSSLPLNYVKAKLSNSDISFLCHKQGHFWHVQRPTMGWNTFLKVNGSYFHASIVSYSEYVVKNLVKIPHGKKANSGIRNENVGDFYQW